MPDIGRDMATYKDSTSGYSSVIEDGAEEALQPVSAAPAGANAANMGDQSERLHDRWTGFRGIYRPASATLSNLPAGIYSAETDAHGLLFEIKRFPSDYLLDLPGLPTRLILDEVQAFWEKENLFRKFGFLHKRGIMMCGPGGCGKTSIIRMICTDIIGRDGVVLLVNKIAPTIMGMQTLREIEPHRPLLTITEDLDEYFKADKSPKQILSMYDGENQVDHVVHIATTNHPEMLEDRIIQRPSRFDMILCLGTPTQEAREAYLRHTLRNELPEEEFQGIVKGTKGLSLAHLKEYVVSTVCLNKSSRETLARLQKNMKQRPTLSKDGGMGFHGEGYQIHYYDPQEEK
jgi:hypothetical protein